MEMHTFCDASEMASSAVSYLRIVEKLTAAHATTIPRLELWAAVLGVEMTELVYKELEQKPDSVTYHSDSKFILCYITNESRRFYVYVSNRVERICSSSAPHQWKYVAVPI